ncbi:ferric/cupric-chelate reductase [Chytriomyces hyalinus]|nr:ferric/cupric-chelate reductase [Chytriomyces hyalinus]
MPLTPSLSVSKLALGLVSLAAFPAAWVFVHFLMANKQWCFSDFCVESMGSRRIPVRSSLVVFYCFLLFTGLVAVASKHLPAFRSLLARRVHSRNTLTVAEVSWFALVLLVSLVAVPAMIWSPYWNMWASMVANMSSGSSSSGHNHGAAMQATNWPWIRIVHQNLILVSGDSLSLLLGFVILPVSKNSFLADFFDLPYNSTMRMHMWLGFTIFWWSMFHLVVTMLAYSVEATPILELFFKWPANATWGNMSFLYITGVVSFVFLAVVVVTSLSYVRRKAYNLFYLTHFLIFVSILFAYLHASMCIFYMIPGLCMYAIDGTMRLASRFSPSYIQAVTIEECGLLSVTVSTKSADAARPGQFMRVNIPSVSKLEFHPWSIVKSSKDTVSFLFAPHSSCEKEWSSRVAAAVKGTAALNTVVHLQGPFGKEMALLKDADGMDAIVFYVAGTGIAACIAAVDELLETATSSVPAIHVFWSTRNTNMSSLSWVQKWSAEKVSKRVNLVMFQTCDEQAWLMADTESAALNHRPELKSLLNKHVALQEFGSMELGVFVCGPERFVRDALESVDTFTRHRKGVRVTVEVESYDL